MSQDTLEYRLGRIEGKLDMLLEAREDQRATVKDHDERITRLERWRWMIVGGCFAVGSIAGFLLRFV